MMGLNLQSLDLNFVTTYKHIDPDCWNPAPKYLYFNRSYI